MVDIIQGDANAGETPSWAQVILDSINNCLLELHTATPGRVESYDIQTGTASIQPLLKRKFRDGEVVDLPLCNEVPVKFPRTQTAFIHLPIKKGDLGLLIFSERSIDRYKNFGGSQDPQDPRKHDLSDGFFIPGGYPKNSPIESPVDGAIHLKNVKSEVIMLEDGGVQLKNQSGSIALSGTGKVSLTNNSVEVIDLLERHLTRLSTILDNVLALTVPTGVGPSGPPINSASFTADKVDVDKMITEIGTLKA